MDATTGVVLGVVGLVLSAITIFAIYYGPIKALKIQRQLDQEREARNRKLLIFKTLMSNRATHCAKADKESGLTSLKRPTQNVGRR